MKNSKKETQMINFETINGTLCRKVEPKPLLADAKVGDLCKRSNGRYTQFHSKHKLSDGSIAYYFTDASGSTDIDGNHCIYECGNNIVSCEPLAPEGSAEWALQMWKLGNDIRNETGVVIMADYESEEIRVKHLVDVFPSGWQIYKEHEQIQEPESMGLAKQICEIDHNLPKGLTSCEAIGLAGFCKECFAKNDGCWKEQEDMKEEPESEQPKSAYQAGDFVVCTYYRSPLPQKNSYERVIEVSGNGIVTKANDGCVTEYDINGNHGDINGWHIERLVKPEEYIICIGCLSGTVRPVSTNGIHIWFHLIGVDDKTIATIRISCLDKETRELVGSLLKAQEEKCHS